MKTHMKPLPECKKPELKLVIWPDECLKYAVAPFPESELGTEAVRNIAGAMIRALYEHYGVGLAAPQVAVPFRIFVMDAYWTKEGAKKRPRVFLNPEITDTGTYLVELPRPGEGCLSFPYDYHSPVRRYGQVELQWLDFKGETHHEWFDGYEAVVIQHEYDHLNGHCFVDRLSLLKQGMAYRRARKMRRRYFKGRKQGMKMFKQMMKSPAALLDRNKAFEAKQRSKEAEKHCTSCDNESGWYDEKGRCTVCSALEPKPPVEHADWCHEKVRSGTVNECNCPLKELEK